MLANLEAELEFNLRISIDPELQREIIAIAEWKSPGDFVRGKSRYKILEKPLEVREGLEVKCIQVKNTGDFNNPQKPGLPGDGDYLQHEEYPEIHPTVGADLIIRPMVVPPVPRGGERLIYSDRDYDNMFSEFHDGSPVTAPLAKGRYGNFTWNSQKLGIIGVGLYDEEDTRFVRLFEEIDFAPGELGLSRITDNYVNRIMDGDPRNLFRFAEKGFWQWGYSIRQLKDVLHTVSHSRNVYFDSEVMWLHDFAECIRKSKMSPEQAYLSQLLRVPSMVLKEMDRMMLTTGLGGMIVMTDMSTEMDINPYHSFLQGYFYDVIEKTETRINELSDMLFKKIIQAYMSNMPQGSDEVQISLETQKTGIIANSALYESMDLIAKQTGTKKPFSLDTFKEKYFAYTQEILHFVDKWREDRGLGKLPTYRFKV